MKKLSILLILITLFLISQPVYADSGWDSYSGYTPSVDYTPSIDYDTPSSSGGSSYYSSSSTKTNMFYVVFLLVGLLTSIKGTKIKFSDKTKQAVTKNDKNVEDVIMNAEHKTGEDSIPDNYDHIISKYLENYTEQKLLDDFYEIFVMIQKAWMNFEYEVLEEYCSNELYKEYKTDLEELKKEHCKNMMSKFELKASNIRNIEKKNNRIIIDSFMEVSFYDYVINQDTKEVVFGNKKEKVDNSYDLEFIIDLDEVEKCPNCGAPVTGRKCEFCHSTIEKKNTSLVLNKKSLMRK